MSTATGAWPSEVTAVYVVCHPEKEKARWDRLLPHLLSVGIPPEKIRPCAPTWGADLKNEEIFSSYSPFARRGVPTMTFKGAGLTRGEISLGMNFAAVIANVMLRPDDGLIITLESDVWLREDFVPRLRELLASAADRPWDYISLGEGVGTRPPDASFSYYAPTKAYEPPHKWVFRCTDSMLFTADYLKRIAKTFLPFREIIDWEMNYQMMLHGGKPLWADPPLAEQGTCFARMPTSLPS